MQDQRRIGEIIKFGRKLLAEAIAEVQAKLKQASLEKGAEASGQDSWHDEGYRHALGTRCIIAGARQGPLLGGGQKAAASCAQSKRFATLVARPQARGEAGCSVRVAKRSRSERDAQSKRFATLRTRHSGGMPLR